VRLEDLTEADEIAERLALLQIADAMGSVHQLVAESCA
jgi:hypothetical protein